MIMEKTLLFRSGNKARLLTGAEYKPVDHSGLGEFPLSPSLIVDTLA